MKEFKKILMSLAVMVMATFGMSASVWAATSITVSNDGGVKLGSITGGKANATYEVSYSDGKISGTGKDVTVDGSGNWSDGQVIEDTDTIHGKLKAFIRDDDTKDSKSTNEITVTVTNKGNDSDTATHTIAAGAFEVVKVAITAEADGDGGSVTAKKGFVGDSINVTATPEDGFVVNYWDINCSKGASSDTTRSYTITDSSDTEKVGFGKVTISGAPSTVDNGTDFNSISCTVTPEGKALSDAAKSFVAVSNCKLEGGKVVVEDSSNDGKFRIKATYGNATAESTDITVKKPVSYSLSISGDSTVAVGNTLQLTGNVTPEYPGDYKEAWTSNKTDVATVDNHGKVTAVAQGEVTITFRATSGGSDIATAATKTINVTTGMKLISSMLLPEEIEISLNETKSVDLAQYIEPEGFTETLDVKFDPTKGVIAGVKLSGNVLKFTGQKVGYATLNIKGNESGKMGSIKITVKSSSSSLSVSPSKKTISKGSKQTISAVTDSVEDAADVTWKLESGSEKYIKIIEDEKGAAVIQGIKATPEGKPAVIIATAPDGSTASASITVVDGTPITKFTLEDVKVTVGFDVPVKATITPKNATNTKITKWEWNGDSIELKKKDGITSGVVVHGKSTVSNLKLKATIEDGEISDDSTAECMVTVYSTPTLKYDSSEGKLTATLPSQVYTGSDDSVNLKSVKGGYLIASYGGNEVWNSGDKYKGSGTSFTVSNSDLQGIVDSIKDKLSGSTATINFKLYPVGESVSGDGSKRNSDVAASQDVTAYQVKVYGENITAATYYGIPKASLKITATPITGYSFSKWSDGSTSNPRTVEVSSSESSNSYQAVAVAGVKTAAGQGKAGADGYDRVPRTGEGSEVIVLWIVLILTAIGGFIAYRKLRPQPVVNKDETSKDSKK